MMSDGQPHPAIDRRELLGAVGAAAAGGLVLADAAGAGPGADVEDKGSAVRITGLKTHLVGPKVYVQIETNLKVTGWGEVSALEPRTANALAQSLFELLDRENPTRVEYLWQKLYRS